MKKNKRKEEKSEKSSAVHSEEIKRLNRVIGQIEGIKKMLESGKKLDAFLMQCKAIHSALKSVESRVLKSHLEIVLGDLSKIEKRKEREEKMALIEELFKQAS